MGKFANRRKKDKTLSVENGRLSAEDHSKVLANRPREGIGQWHKRFYALSVPVLFAFLLLASFRVGRSVVHTFDTGLYLQLLNNIEKSATFASSVTGEHNFLAHHFQPIILAIVPLHLLVPSAMTLFAVDALAAAACAYLIMRRYASLIGGGVFATALLAMLLHPSVANRVFYSFDPETLALPFLAIQALLLVRREPWTRKDFAVLIVSQVFAGFCKEPIWIINSVVAWVLAVRSIKYRRSFALLGLINFVLFLWLFYFWMPAHSDLSGYHPLLYYQNAAVDPHQSFALVRAMVLNLFSLRSLRTFGLYMVVLSGIVPFLSLNPSLIAAMPGLLMILTASYGVVHDPGNQYQLLALPFLWVSGLEFLSSSRFDSYQSAVRRYLLLIMVAAPLAYTLPQIGTEIVKVASNPHTRFIGRDMTAIRNSIPNKETAVIIADGNLQPLLADYPNVAVLLEFGGNPRKLSDADRERVTDVVTMLDPQSLDSCDVKGDGLEKDSSMAALKYDLEAFSQYCHWLTESHFKVERYAQSHLFHFHR